MRFRAWRNGRAGGERPDLALDKLAEAYGNIPGTFRLVWQAHPAATATMALLALVSGLVPAAQAWVGNLIVDSEVPAI